MAFSEGRVAKETKALLMVVFNGDLPNSSAEL